MCGFAKRLGIALALTMIFLGGVVGLASADQQQEILNAFKQGITLYKVGDFAGARERFDRVLAMDPGMQTALKMRDMAEFGQFAEMKDTEELGEVAEKVLDLMTRATRQRKRTLEDPAALIEDFESQDLATYGKARIALTGHGPYAVPYVVPLLALDVEESQTVVARAVSLLADLHPDAVMPLIVALENAGDSLLKARIADVLGQIGDERAVPALMMLAGDEAALQDARTAAMEAVRSITASGPGQRGSATAQYIALADAYLREDKDKVGYTYGLTAEVWDWNPDGEELPDRIVYEQVPNYLYFQRMATEVALGGLAADPGATELQALLAASLVRQLALCEFFKSAEVRLGGREIEQQVRQEAAQRAEELCVQVPVALHMLATPVVGRALQLTLELGDGSASLYLVKAIDAKLAAAGPGALDELTAQALVSALGSGDKDVRYNASVVLVSAAPDGEGLPAEEVMQVMGAALKAASDRTALVAMDNFQMRNKLVHVLRGAGVATSESKVVDVLIEHTLSIEPSVDIVFLSGNLPEQKFARIVALLKGDPRTKAAPLYVVVDPTEEAPEMAAFDQIEQVLRPDALRAEALAPILQEQVFARSRSAFTDEEQALVLKAAEALDEVDPLATAYPLVMVEPALVKALRGYGEEVSAAAAEALAGFGSPGSAAPLAGLVASDASQDLRVAACKALAAVLKRSDAPAGEDVVAVLKAGLDADAQPLRQVAAEALGAAGLGAEAQMTLLRTKALGLE